MIRYTFLRYGLGLLLLLCGCDERRAGVPEGHELVWADEFDGSQLDLQKWGFPSYKERGDCLMNTPGTAVVEGGVLKLSTLYQDGRVHGAILETRNTRKFTRGYFEARIKFQRQQGHHGCFWLQSPKFKTGTGNPETSGVEIDIIEWFGAGRVKGWAGMNVYYQDTDQSVRRSPCIPKFDLMGGPEDAQPHKPLADLSADFHVYGLLWTEKELVFTCDGVEIMRETDAVPQVEEYINLSLISSEWERKRLNLAGLPDSMVIDYVRVYEQAKGAE